MPCILFLAFSGWTWAVRSSNFLIAAVQFHGSAGALLDADFQFPVPVSSGDSLAKLFSGKGLELQLVTGSDVLQGEVSPFELHLETPGEVANCIHLEPASSSSTGIKSCSVPGIGRSLLHVSFENKTFWVKRSMKRLKREIHPVPLEVWLTDPTCISSWSTAMRKRPWTPCHTGCWPPPQHRWGWASGVD